jgi:hypothetical protein
MAPRERISLGTAGYQNPNRGALRDVTISGARYVFIHEEQGGDEAGIRSVVTITTDLAEVKRDTLRGATRVCRRLS